MYEHLVSGQLVTEVQMEHSQKKRLIADRREEHFDFSEELSSFSVMGMTQRRKTVVERVLEVVRARLKQVLLCHQ